MDMVEINCSFCNKAYKVSKFRLSQIKYRKKVRNQSHFCSHDCELGGRGAKPPQDVVCLNCNKEFKKRWGHIKKSSNHFCTRSCAATYNNTHKTKGNRKSKLEYYLENKLVEIYPTLEFHFTRKDVINSELDIYIPQLKLAFELNGIFHYEPIYGAEKLNQIQNNDNRKFQACLEMGIELCIIDTSKLGYFKESNALPYLKIVQRIINNKVKELNLNLHDFPHVVYNKDEKNEFIKNCLCCGVPFENLLKTKKKFCNKECRQKYAKENSESYKRFLTEKKLIENCVKQKMNITQIGKKLGYKNLGGQFYILKWIVDNEIAR